MITRDEITCIGKFNKPHGINGEISAVVSSPIDLSKCKCIICDIDGIFVPFFITNIREKSTDTLLLTIEGINDETGASLLVNNDMYILKKDYQDSLDEDDDEIPVDFLRNFKVSINNAHSGEIVDIDDSTANVLFVISLDNGSTILIPAVNEFITAIDLEKNTMALEVPVELLDL